MKANRPRTIQSRGSEIRMARRENQVGGQQGSNRSTGKKCNDNMPVNANWVRQVEDRTQLIPREIIKWKRRQGEFTLRHGMVSHPWVNKGLRRGPSRNRRPGWRQGR